MATSCYVYQGDNNRIFNSAGKIESEGTLVLLLLKCVHDIKMEDLDLWMVAALLMITISDVSSEMR